MNKNEHFTENDFGLTLKKWEIFLAVTFRQFCACLLSAIVKEATMWPTRIGGELCYYAVCFYFENQNFDTVCDVEFSPE